MKHRGTEKTELSSSFLSVTSVFQLQLLRLLESETASRVGIEMLRLKFDAPPFQWNQTIPEDISRRDAGIAELEGNKS